MGNLQEKIMEVRKAIPPLQKKRNSENVDYEFVNIDAVYKHLTPAMNKVGVNFDVVRETASRQDANGNSVYYTWIPDARAWLYEADLTVKWTDAESGESETAEIHAVGTNESVPEKAKGTAWTYALKYYFFAKFSIDQGGCMEDADMTDINVKPEGEKTKKADAKPIVESGKAEVKESKPPVTEPAKTVTEVEVKAPEAVRPESGEFVKIPESAKVPESVKAEPKVDPDEMSLEEAKRVVCNFGINKGKTLGEIALNGEKGIADIRWLATTYGGKNEMIKEAARMLLAAAELPKAS